MLGGYWQKLLKIDLTSNKVWTETILEEDLRKYIGGSGLAAKILTEECSQETNPLGAENVLIFMTGPFTGTNVITSGRHAVVAKSPLTGIWGESDVGGYWGAELKKTGHDGIVIYGAASSPVYLWVDEKNIEIRDASDLWGKDCFSATESIQAATSDTAQVACIGIAGEKMVKFASIMSDGRDARAAGRSGMGAVMGSKNLKAVAVKGTLKGTTVDPKKLLDINKSIAPTISERTKGMNNFGTGGALAAIEHAGGLPIKNWSKGVWETGAEKISGVAMTNSILHKTFHCKSCIIGCGRVTKVDEGKYTTGITAGPEYETLAMLGSLCMIDDLKAINYANYLCNLYGMDTITTGSVIAFAMEAFEKGIITMDNSDGLELSWGNADAAIELIHRIAAREGVGDLLAEGSRAAASRIGKGSEEFAIHVKGLELPAHDPRAWVSLGVGYATSNRGACHLQAFSHGFEKTVTMKDLGYPQALDRFAPQGKGELVAKTQNLMAMFDALKLCKFLCFGGIDLSIITAWVEAVTGWDCSSEELLETGERLFNLKRLFNVACGVSCRDDVLPQRIRFQRRGEGGTPDNLPPLEEMLNEYYAVRGWTKEGLPSSAKISALGLEDVATSLGID